MGEDHLQGNSGPVNPGSVARQQSGQPAPGSSSVSNAGYYSTSNPFAAAPTVDESDARRARYLDDRMEPQAQSRYGGPGMAGRLMTA